MALCHFMNSVWVEGKLRGSGDTHTLSAVIVFLQPQVLGTLRHCPCMGMMVVVLYLTLNVNVNGSTW